MMTKSDEIIYLSAGSNMGERKEIMVLALRRLSRTPGIHVLRTSRLYETEPWGKRNQPFFLNCIIELKTTFSPDELLKKLKFIENTAGRTASREKWGPRLLDLDIILFGERAVKLPDLIIPHAHLASRRYILEPLSTLCPDFVIPVLEKSVKEALNSCRDESGVFVLEDEWPS